MRQRFNDLADQANEGYSAAREGATRGMRSAYSTAREYPGTIAAIVVGLGVTAFLLWAARRAGGWQNLQSTATDYMRDGYARAREGDRPFWKRVIETGNQTESDLDRAITLIEQTGAMQETMSRARAYADLAKVALKVMPDSDIKLALADIADFCVERAY